MKESRIQASTITALGNFWKIKNVDSCSTTATEFYHSFFLNPAIQYFRDFTSILGEASTGNIMRALRSSEFIRVSNI